MCHLPLKLPHSALLMLFHCRETGTRGCSPKEGGNYRCRCKRGFAGRYCERGGICTILNVSIFEDSGVHRSIFESICCNIWFYIKRNLLDDWAVVNVREVGIITFDLWKIFKQRILSAFSVHMLDYERC